VKASDRCKSQRQGDRCTKKRGHNSFLAANPDPEHLGTHALWVDGEPEKTAVTTLKFKRNRRANNFVRSLSTLDPAAILPDQRAAFKGTLAMLLDNFRRGR
jgi:hypothetical protein